MKMNVKLLRKIQKHILAEPKSYDQNAIISETCGTIACIGGWAFLLGGGVRTPSVNELSDARDFLGINREQGDRLFEYVTTSRLESSMAWPAKFIRQYLAAKTPRGRANAAVRRIDHFIKTNGAE